MGMEPHHPARKKWRKHGNGGYSFGSTRQAKAGERTAGVVPMYGPTRGWHAFGHTGNNPSDSDNATDLGTFDESEFGSEAEALFRAKDHAQAWVQTGKKARRDNPANVGGASSGALQARGRQGNPDHVFGRGKYPPASKIKDHRYKWWRAQGYSAKDAKEYADAEKWASDNDVEYQWEYEGREDGYGVIARRGDDVASLGGIEEDAQGTPFGRQIEADLALELRSYDRKGNPTYKAGTRTPNPTQGWNLDGHAPNDLLKIAAKIKRREAVFGAKTTKQLTTYCRSKARAMKLREAGQINEAVALENQCDRIYKQLPKWAKW